MENERKKHFASIKRNNSGDDSYTCYYPVLIVGAGPAGIALGCRLKQKLGFDQFAIFERHSNLGGTWWINRYPGVACDVASVFYSFSFSPFSRWTKFHAPGAEITKYLNLVCERFQIVDKIQCDTLVSEARWLNEEEVWEVTLIHLVPGTGDLSEEDRELRILMEGENSVYLRKEVVRAKIFASAVGSFAEPQSWPRNIPGREKFQGPIFHAARWNHTVDLADKDVVVVGTGCSSIQIVPSLLLSPHNVRSITQLMRTPPWVLPAFGEPPFGEEKWNKYSSTLLSYLPGFGLLMRLIIFLDGEHDFRLFGGEEYHQIERTKYEQNLTRYMKTVAPKKYHEALIPDYGVGCKRRVGGGMWLKSLNDPRVTLTTAPLLCVEEKSVTLGSACKSPEKGNSAGSETTSVPADAIILANGYKTTEWLHSLKVRGKDGKYLEEVWNERGGPQAYLGTAMDGFPNFFIIFGPNTVTGHSSVILAIENMVNYSLKFMKPILNGDVATVELKKEAEVAWAEEIQGALRQTVFSKGGCTSWYKTDTEWNAAAYPYSQVDFWWRCTFPKWRDWNMQYTRKGLIKRRLGQTLKLCVIFAAIAAATSWWQAGIRAQQAYEIGCAWVSDTCRSLFDWIKSRF
ncbi:putative flavin-binding monooxygenase [Xylona heveae TC161]|uniref:Putative flavin-binding monooxygenase n=1 Tax=Xylona heveae (strain CBS 132557 / TC161) TaxID=1328760 RepID=A0A165GJG0_XYLHT|nr:putative flavin-binding monooxygenase [Xylona heveae TC161]KZF22262.1 putative flavin-binding monooxygenase [Xylona heveae TC161]